MLSLTLPTDFFWNRPSVDDWENNIAYDWEESKQS